MDLQALINWRPQWTYTHTCADADRVMAASMIAVSIVAFIAYFDLRLIRRLVELAAGVEMRITRIGRSWAKFYGKLDPGTAALRDAFCRTVSLAPSTVLAATFTEDFDDDLASQNGQFTRAFADQIS